MPAKERTGWFIYALGSGWGHLNRAMTLAQVAAQERPVHVLTNSPYVEQWLPTHCSLVHWPCQQPQSNWPHVSQPNCIAMLQTGNLTLYQLLPTESLDTARRAIRTLLMSVSYGCLLVDTFPRGLIGELAELIPQQQTMGHVLIHRDLNPHYIAAKDLAAFVIEHYDGILIPGESAPLAHLPRAIATAPWLSRSPMELPDPAFVREQFLIPSDRPLVIVCATGQPQELALFGQLTKQLKTAFPMVTLRCLAATCPPHCPPDCWLSHWPGMDVLQLADVVIGSGGYNLVHECAALKVPLVAFAMPRRYDRQARRILNYGHLVQSAEEVTSVLTQLLSSYLPLRALRSRPHYPNGVRAAVKQVAHWQRAWLQSLTVMS